MVRRKSRWRKDLDRAYMGREGLIDESAFYRMTIMYKG
jgi:hypothetical protein